MSIDFDNRDTLILRPSQNPFGNWLTFRPNLKLMQDSTGVLGYLYVWSGCCSKVIENPSPEDVVISCLCGDFSRSNPNQWGSDRISLYLFEDDDVSSNEIWTRWLNFWFGLEDATFHMLDSLA